MHVIKRRARHVVFRLRQISQKSRDKKLLTELSLNSQMFHFKSYNLCYIIYIINERVYSVADRRWVNQPQGVRNRSDTKLRRRMRRFKIKIFIRLIQIDLIWKIGFFENKNILEMWIFVKKHQFSNGEKFDEKWNFIFQM